MLNANFFEAVGDAGVYLCSPRDPEGKTRRRLQLLRHGTVTRRNGVGFKLGLCHTRCFCRVCCCRGRFLLLDSIIVFDKKGFQRFFFFFFLLPRAVVLYPLLLYPLLLYPLLLYCYDSCLFCVSRWTCVRVTSRWGWWRVCLGRTALFLFSFQVPRACACFLFVIRGWRQQARPGSSSVPPPAPAPSARPRPLPKRLVSRCRGYAVTRKNRCCGGGGGDGGGDGTTIANKNTQHKRDC